MCLGLLTSRLTLGLVQDQHSWGEGNRKGLKKGSGTVALWRPLRLDFFSLGFPGPCLGHIPSTTSLQVCEGRAA